MKAAIALALGLLVLSGCARKKTVHRTPPPPRPVSIPTTAPPKPVDTAGNRPPTARPEPPPPPPMTAEPLLVETGVASWYGHPYHGRIAANGERYDMETMVAAHRTLPFNTWVRVVNMTNQKSVELRIIDRGPFVGNRIIDVSHAAARALELIGRGTAEVRVEILSMPETIRTAGWAVQVGAYREKVNAERARIRMAAKYGNAKLVFRDGEPGLWRVLVGAERTEEKADALRVKIRQESGERNAFVVRLDS
jgi:rare lipoprotein A